MLSFARLLMLVGAGMFVVGGLLYLMARSGIPLGRLPGDIRIQGENYGCVIAIGTSILLSIVLTILLNVAARFLNK